MNKWIAALLAVICASTLSLPAIAEDTPLVPEYYDHRLDSPLYDSLPEGMTFPERRETMSGHFEVRNLLALEGGGVLLAGTYEYFDQQMEESFDIEHEELQARTDAYAIALDAAGERLWSMRLGDPQADANSFYAYRLADGRHLLRYFGYDGHFGPSYFVVNQKGQVDSMLSSRALKELGVLYTLSAHGDALYAGGMTFDGSAFLQMEKQDQLMKLDSSLAPVWAIDNPFGMAATLEGCVTTEDGVIWYGGMGGLDEGARPALVKVSHAGEVLYVYDDANPYAVGAVNGVAPLADGGLLFISNVDPREATPFETVENSYLCFVDAEGTLVDVKGYQAEWGIESFGAIHAFADGYVLAGTMEDTIQVGLLYADAQGEVLGMAKLQGRNGDMTSYTTVSFAESKGGKLYVYGNEEDVFHDPNERHGVITRQETYYIEIKPEDFAQTAQGS